MEEVLLLGCGVAGISACSGLAAIELREARRPGQYQVLEVRFGRNVSGEAIVAVLNRLAGVHRFACLRLSVVADHGGIHHYVAGDQATIDTYRGSLLAHLPGSELVPGDLSLHEAALGGAIHLRGRLRTLRPDAIPATSAAVLASLQPLGKDERVALTWLIRPGRQMTVPRAREGQLIEPEERRRLRIKNDSSILLVSGTLTAQAGNRGRALHLLSRVTSALRTSNTGYGQIYSSPRPRFWLRALDRRHSFTIGDRYSAEELAGLLAWPADAPALPGLQLGTSPKRLASNIIPSSGRIFGRSTWPGSDRLLAQPIVGGLSHSLVVGPTGVGKSTLLTNLIEQDLKAGRGLVLIDGKGDTARAVLERVPEQRRSGVIVLDCASGGPQPGIQLFRGHDAELAADVVLGVLSDLYRAEWGPLSERYLRAGLVAVAHDPKGTLADVPYVFSDPAYRRKLAAKLHDPLSRMTLTALDAMSPAERQQQLAAPLNKLGQLLGRPVVRTVLGQSQPTLDFTQVLRHNQIVVISLSPAQVGGPAARLIGALSVFALFQAVQARQQLAERARRPFLVYLDEPRALGDLPMPLDALLEQARGLGIGLTLAPQSINQLPKNVREAALTNIATRVVFRQDADDARLLARDLSGVTPEDLGDLGQYEAIARLGLGPGQLATPASLHTLKPSRPSTDGDALAKSSADRFGQSLADIDHLLKQRHKAQGESTPVGRTRRQS